MTTTTAHPSSAGGHTNTSGHLYERDLVNDASHELPVPAPDAWHGLVGAISDDAQRVAFDIGRAIPYYGGFQILQFVAAYDRPMNTLIDLAPETTPEFAHGGPTTIEMSADGSRVAFSANGTSGPPAGRRRPRGGVTSRDLGGPTLLASSPTARARRRPRRSGTQPPVARAGIGAGNRAWLPRQSPFTFMSSANDRWNKA